MSLGFSTTRDSCEPQVSRTSGRLGAGRGAHTAWEHVVKCAAGAPEKCAAGQRSRAVSSRMPAFIRRLNESAFPLTQTGQMYPSPDFVRLGQIHA
jgi:hypothetical protein